MSGRPGEEQIVVRMSSELHRWLREEADRNERTVSQQVRFYVRKALNEADQ